MKILDNLRAQQAHEDSMFRAQLLREDIARLERLIDMAKTSANLAEFERTGLSVGWTQNDMMTHQLKPPLVRLLAAIYVHTVEGPSNTRETELAKAWQDFAHTRLQKLVRCL